MLKKKPPQLLCTDIGLKSASLKLMAQGLSAHYKRKVFRTTKLRPLRKQFKYGQSINKIQQYDWFRANEIPSLEYSTDAQWAKEKLAEGATIFGRKYLNASCGKGIVVMEKAEDFVTCPVYTLYKNCLLYTSDAADE